MPYDVSWRPHLTDKCQDERSGGRGRLVPPPGVDTAMCSRSDRRCTGSQVEPSGLQPLKGRRLGKPVESVPGTAGLTCCGTGQ